jgi:hypothetical protein
MSSGIEKAEIGHSLNHLFQTAKPVIPLNMARSRKQLLPQLEVIGAMTLSTRSCLL